ncbi:MAG: ATP-dependent zinc metalloprotease FtsH [Bacteroidales bacterium]|nr:ATP-dependent zinc metalloprotease FtsH [Bacteroidales bacterium]
MAMNDQYDERDRMRERKPQGRAPRRLASVVWVYLALLFVFFVIVILNPTAGVKEINMRTFLYEMLQPGDVEKIVVVKEKKVEVTIREDRISGDRYKKYFSGREIPPSQGKPQFCFQIGSLEMFETAVKEVQADLPKDEQVFPEYDNDRGHVMNQVMGLLLPLAFFFLVIFFFSRMFAGGGRNNGGVFNVGKSRAQVFDRDSAVKVDFKDVAGLEEAKVEIREIVEFLKNPKKYTDLGGKIPKGALLVGPPGTGKTLLAKAVAGEANVPFFSLSGSDFVEMFVGVGASRVRDLFKQAKEKAPCIVFIDEIDAIGRARGKNPNFGANDERENTLNQLLTEMDGFASNAGVIILAATNRADILDKALLRAGRFDRQINVELPDLAERKAIFGVHLRPVKYDKSMDLDFLAKQTPGFSGADIANVCNEAALIAARKDKKVVEKQDFLDAIDRIVGGLERRNKIISDAEKRTIAFHEAGHATVSWMLEHANPLVKVTIIPRGKALGAAWYLPEERQITTTEQMQDEMAATLGGRAAEELVFGEVSTGALNDLERVTKQAYAMITYFGMSKQLGNVSFFDSTGQSEYAFTKPYSEQTAEAIDREAHELIDRAYERATEILKTHREGLEKLALQLLDKEVIFTEDVERVFGPRPFGNQPETFSGEDRSGDTPSDAGIS